jgi:NTP pyrophosphatase (non-canonical NTP hydrolase)
MSSIGQAVQDTLAEIAAGQLKHGQQHTSHAPDHQRLAILTAELGEVAQELRGDLVDLRLLRAEVIQVAAVAVAWAAQL